MFFKKGMGAIYLIISDIFYLLGMIFSSKKMLQLAGKFDENNIRVLNQLSEDPKYSALIANLSFSSLFDLARKNPVLFKSHRLYFDFFLFSTQFIEKSVAQLNQDIVALFFSQKKRDGFFIEIGVGNGKTISNTFLLEKEFGWKGVLAEPNPIFHSSIHEFREKSIIIPKAVYDQSGKILTFICDETEPLFSSISDYYSGPKSNKKIKVETISFNDLLSETNTPNHINYVSIDTEGSEYNILKSFNFEKYKVDVFTVEHNHEKEKLNKIISLLAGHNYIQVLEKISRFDAWFVRKGLLNFTSNHMQDDSHMDELSRERLKEG